MPVLDVTKLQSEAEKVFDVALNLPPAVAGFPAWQGVAQVISALVHARSVAEPVRVIGVSGSQGSGKSSLSHTLAQTLCQVVPATVTCSIDDFYLSKQQRLRLAETIHPLLQTRGVPGTHDWQHLARVLNSVRHGSGSEYLPQFDKGLDDRLADQHVELECLVLEGWCMGVMPQPEAALAEPVNQLEREEDPDGRWRRWVNQQIKDHYQPLWSAVDFWVHLRVPSFAQVLQWRAQQERQLPADRQMSPAEIERFIAHYERLTRWMWASPGRGPGLQLNLDEAHNVSGFKFSAATSLDGGS